MYRRIPLIWRRRMLGRPFSANYQKRCYPRGACTWSYLATAVNGWMGATEQTTLGRLTANSRCNGDEESGANTDCRDCEEAEDSQDHGRSHGRDQNQAGRLLLVSCAVFIAGLVALFLCEAGRSGAWLIETL
jgi:hypothetical protein